MNNKTINDIYLKAHNKTRVKGKDNTMAELLPYFMMDECRDLYRKHIERMRCCYKLQSIKSRWLTGSHDFNVTFTSVYNADQRDYIYEKMDDFDSYIRDTEDKLIELVKKGLEANKVGVQYRETVAICLVCNVLAQAAQIQWGNVNLNAKGEQDHNMNIEKVQKATIQFAYEIYKPMEKIDLNQFKGVTECVNQLCHDMIGWLAEDAKDESKKKARVWSWTTWKKKTGYVPPEKKRIGRGVPITYALEQRGYEKVVDEVGNGLFTELKPLQLCEKYVREQNDDEPSKYEYVYYGMKGHQGSSDKDTFILFKRRREDVV